VKNSKNRQFFGCKLLQTLEGNNRNWDFSQLPGNYFPKFQAILGDVAPLLQLGK